MGLKLSFGQLKLDLIFLETILQGEFHAFHFLIEQSLVFFGGLMHLSSKLDVIVHD